MSSFGCWYGPHLVVIVGLVRPDLGSKRTPDDLDVQDKSWTPRLRVLGVGMALIWWLLLVWCARIWGVSGFKGAFEWRCLVC
jgi:hypothetical protein